MSRPINFDAIKKIWETPPTCKHKHSSVRIDENGVYWMRCLDCGLFGYTNEEGARRLGWIE